MSILQIEHIMRESIQRNDIPNVTVKSFIGSAPVHQEAVLPFGYGFTSRQSEGILKIIPGSNMYGQQTTSTVVLLPMPIVITKIFKGNFEEGAPEKLELAYYDSIEDEWRFITEEREKLSKVNTITSLNNYGYRVIHKSERKNKDSDASELIHFLKLYEDVNAHVIPRETLSSKLGWNTSMTSFAPFQEKTYVLPQGEEQKEMLKNGYIISKGTINDYVASIKNTISAHPFAIYAYSLAYTAPLLKILNAPSFSVEYARHSGFGKSVCQRLALSVYGDPNVLMKSWKSTSTGAEWLLDFNNDLVMCFEDAHLNENQDVVEDIFYTVFNGAGKNRGAKSGGNRKTPKFRGILFSSSEDESVNRINHDGIRRRLITVAEKPFADKTVAKNVARLLEKIHLQYCGLAGKYWIDFLCDNRDRWSQWRARYMDILDTMDDNLNESFYSDIDKDSMSDQNRLLATSQLALELMNEYFGFQFCTTEIITTVAKSVYKQIDGHSKPIHALQELVNWVVSNERSLFTYKSTTGKQYGVILSNDCIGVLKGNLTEFLINNKYSPSVLDKWKEMGILRYDSDGKNPKVQVAPKSKVYKRMRMVAFDWQKLEEYCGEGFYATENDES